MARAGLAHRQGEARDRPGGDIADHAQIGGTVFTQVCGADGKSVHRGVVEYGEVVGSGGGHARTRPVQSPSGRVSTETARSWLRMRLQARLCDTK